MKPIHACGIAGLALMATLGCGKMSKDTSKVIANVAGEKITEKAFGETIKAMVPDEAKAKEILTSDPMREKRNEFLGQLAKAKAMVKFGHAQSLTKDPGTHRRPNRPPSGARACRARTRLDRWHEGVPPRHGRRARR